MVDGPKGVGEGSSEEVPRDEPDSLGAAATVAVTRGSRRENRTTTNPDDGAPGGRGPRSGRGLAWKIVVAAALIVLLAFVPAFVSGLKKTPKNMIGISYGGGPFESAHFQRIIKPGSGLFFNGWFDPLYLYPADQQNYIVSLSPRVGAIQGKDSIIAPTSDRVPLTYQLAVYFKLNTDLLRQFHEQLGLQYTAYTSKGWNNLLQDTFRQNVENAVQEQTRLYTVAQLYGNRQNLTQLQNAVQQSLSQRLTAALGNPYFCAPTFQPGGACDPPTFIVKQIDIPSTVASAFVNEEAARIQITQRQDEANGLRALNASGANISGQNYVMLKAIESGGVTFWVLPGDSPLTLTTPSTGSGSSTTPSAPPGATPVSKPASTTTTSRGR